MSDQSGATNPLNATAYWTAAVRGQECAREDALFRDPWAAALAGPVGQAWLASRGPAGGLPMALRTRYFDDFLQRVTRQERGPRQVVLPAAGLDTRAFRLGWPAGTVVYEVDQPSVLLEKEARMSALGAVPTCERRVVAADLMGAWRENLAGAGFDRQQPSVWLLEGFLFYISSEEIERLLSGLTGLAAPGSYLGFDVVNSVTLTHPLTRPWVEMQASMGAPWIGTLDDPAGFLAGLGWRASLTQAGAADANWGRWPYPVIPVDAPTLPHNWFVTAAR